MIHKTYWNKNIQQWTDSAPPRDWERTHNQRQWQKIGIYLANSTPYPIINRHRGLKRAITSLFNV